MTQFSLLFSNQLVISFPPQIVHTVVVKHHVLYKVTCALSSSGLNYAAFYMTKYSLPLRFPSSFVPNGCATQKVTAVLTVGLQTLTLVHDETLWGLLHSVNHLCLVQLAFFVSSSFSPSLSFYPPSFVVYMATIHSWGRSTCILNSGTWGSCFLHFISLWTGTVSHCFF